jgi:anti-sigma factor RsiW
MALLDGELSADLAQPVAAHIEECAACRELADALRSDSRILTAWIVPSLPANTLLESNLRKAARRISTKRSRGFGLVVPFLRRQCLLTAGASALTTMLAIRLSTISPVQ